MSNNKSSARQKIRYRIRKKVSGTPSKPRLCVFRSNTDIYAQLIDDSNGVTIAAASSKQKDNWHSASSSDNYATPTKDNSQRKTREKNNNWVEVVQNVLRPGNNGIDNILQIDYQFESPGTLLSVYLFNQQGVQVCKILNNLICGKKGSYNWKGLDNQSNYINTGVYILVAEAFHLSGMTKRYKKIIGIKRD
jgi:ribosomal protein L18